MVSRNHIITAIGICALSLNVVPAFAGVNTYDFSAAANNSLVTPATIGNATFSSPSDPGAYTFGPNAGLFSSLGPFVLSSGGVTAALDVSFAVPQSMVAFDFALGDFLGAGGGDTLTVTTNTGVVLPVTAGLVGSDFFPEGSVSLSDAHGFSSIELTSAYPIVIADLTSVPEPASMMVLALGLTGILAARHRRR